MTVRGGVVQGAYAKGDEDIEIGILDFDNFESEESQKEAERILSDVENGWSAVELVELAEEGGENAA